MENPDFDHPDTPRDGPQTIGISRTTIGIPIDFTTHAWARTIQQNLDLKLVLLGGTDIVEAILNPLFAQHTEAAPVNRPTDSLRARAIQRTSLALRW